MAETKIYPKGIVFFEPNPNAPAWVKGSIIINIKELSDWALKNPDVLTHSDKYGNQLKLTVTEKGLQVDTWKPTPQKNTGTKQPILKSEDDDIPF